LLSAHLEDLFRQALGDDATPDRSASIGFAVEFTRLLVRVLPERIPDHALKELQKAIASRVDLLPDEIEILLKLALAPESRSAIGENELRAFGARFGSAEEAALRAAVEEELDLTGFSERYGAAEALLLLDALFLVCASDGTIDGAEIGRLTRAARQLGIDQMLVGALFRKHDVRHASGDFTVALDKPRIVIGRSNTAGLQLPDPQVAPRHCELVRTGENQWRLVDLGSGRPTILNGQPTASAPVAHGDQLRVGPYTLSLDPTGTTLTAFGSQAFSALSVRDLKRTINKVSLLDRVSFTVFSGEVVAVVGPSGAGKTTLLNAIAGIAPADTGDVLLDRQPFHQLLASDRSMIGMVPQDDVVHPELTCEESLYFSGRLRFPADVDREVIETEVGRVLGELGIEHIRKSRIGDAVRRGISGGQRKRVNLGQELLTRSTRILFLDEPTSGLDPQTAQDIVSLIRQLADDGRMVFLVTHDVTPSIMSMVDHLMVLAPGGRLAWFGPPEDALSWFKVKSVDEIFARLPDKPAEDWGTDYREGPAFRKYVRTREHMLGLEEMEIGKGGEEVQEVRKSSWSQYRTLTARYAKVKMRDVTGLAVLLSQAPILGLAMYVVFPDPDPATMFMLALSALWFGASGSVRELISERTIWRREARVGLGTIPYLASKVTVLGAMVTFQCVVLASMSWVLLGLGEFGFDPFLLCSVTTLTGLVGMALGLLMSSIFSSSEAAVGTLPLLLIPQITFGGLIVKVKEMGTLAETFSYAMIVRYSFDASIKCGDELTRPGSYGNDREPMGIGGFLYDLGLRKTSDADDMGMPLEMLCGILVAFLVVFLAGTTLFTSRSRAGN
jgi:ABC transport system ATP-binding/permease protein